MGAKEQYVQSYFDSEAHRYDRTHGTGQYGAQYGITHHYLPFWRRYLKKTDNVLEIGCGTGVFTHALSRIVKRVDAIDLSPAMLEQAKKRDPDQKKIAFAVASAEHLPFPDKKFDAVVCVNSFSYIVDQKRALQEIRRILKPGGTLLTIDMNLLCPAYWVMYITRPRNVRAFFPQLLRSIPAKVSRRIAEQGFDFKECYGGNFVPHGVGKLWAWLLFIPIDKTLGNISLFRKFGMRMFCAAKAGKSLLKPRDA